MTNESDRRLRATLAFQTDPTNFDSDEEQVQNWRNYVAVLKPEQLAQLRSDLERVMGDESKTWAEKYNAYVGYSGEGGELEAMCREHFAQVWLLAFGTPWRERS